MQNLLALPAGTELVEDYRILRVLGAGGFGLTYLAREETLDRSVTIKEYFPSDFAAREATLSVRPRSADAETDYGWGLERFIDEAQTLARFDHPNINRVYRYFRANNTAYMVLQFEEGQNFKSWLASLGRAPRQAELDAIMAPLLDALEMIHGGNFLHRDIAPDNIIIRKNGAPVLIDFGSARGEMVQLSKTVSALVKPGYSPYEQYGISGRQQGPWTDIYSLGASLYQAIGGKRPTDAPTRMMSDDVRPAAQVALSSYRPQFLAAIDHALRLKVDDRPQSIAAWRKALLPPADKPVIAHVGRPKPAAGVILAPPPLEPVSSAAAIPKIFRRVGDGDPVSPGAEVPAPAARTSLKKRIVRLLEKVAATPATPAQSLPASVPRPEAPIPVPAPVAPAVAQIAAAPLLPAVLPQPPRKAAAPAAGARAAGGWRRWFAQKPATAASPALPPVAAPPVASPPVAGVAAPVVRVPPPARSAPGPGSRAVALKLLAGATVSALLLSYQDQIRTAWQMHGWKDWPGFAASGPAPASTTPGATAKRQPPRPASERKTETRSGASDAATAQPANPAAPPIDEVVLKGHRGAVHAVTFVPGGKSLISTGHDGTLRLWDTGKAELLRTLEAGEAPTGALAVQDRTAAVGHQDGTIGVWDLDKGQRLHTFKRNDAMIWALAFAGDGQRVLSAGHDWAVALWDRRREAGPVHLFEGHENAVQALAYSGARTASSGSGALPAMIASGGADRHVKLWHATDYGLIRTYRGHKDFVSTLAFSPDGAHLASGSFDKVVRIWSTTESGNSRTLRGHKGRVTQITFSIDGQILASASEDGTVRLWDWKRGRVVRTLAGHTGSVRSVSFSPDGRTLATAGEDGTIRIWDATTLPKVTASRS